MRRVAQKCKGNNAAHVKKTTPYRQAGFGGANALVPLLIASKNIAWPKKKLDNLP